MKFSILTCSYNKGKYLEDYFRSIYEQKYRPLEIVFLNDCSNDDTLSIIYKMERKLEEKGIDFTYLDNKERLYCGSSYRKAVERVSGHYVGIVDADDMLMPNVIQRVCDAYQKHPNIGWIYTQFMICDIKMKEIRKGFCRAPKKGENLIDLADKKIHGYGHWRTYNSKFIDKPYKLYEKRFKCAVDKGMGYRLEEMAPGMFLNQICYKYRRHPEGSKNSVSSTKYALEMWRKIVEKSKKRRKEYNKEIFSITNG